MDKYNFTKYIKDAVYINKKNSYANMVKKEIYTYVVAFLPGDSYDNSREITNKYNRAMFELYKRILLSSENCDIKLVQLIYDDSPLIYNDITHEIMKIQNRTFDEHEIPGTIIKMLDNLTNTINSIKDNNVTCIIVGNSRYLINHTLPTNINIGISSDEASIDLTASANLEISPNDAIFARGLRSSPLFADTRNSILSMP